ncbi:diguanylate cyclase [Trichocoleus desertorum AS-A10]|uniref:GGDEF domain-containing response regulator n=1 Tax=Trichocoleus desertorum TaxID=1481672 RepID=UPI0032991992
MTASILIVGENYFLAALLDRVGDLADCTIETATSANEAIPLIQAQQPDLLILQASSDSLYLCQQIKEQSRLAWIYCLLLADDAPRLSEAVSQISSQAVECSAEALERGADAYLVMNLSVQHGSLVVAELSARQNRLLQAQVQAGLRVVRNHRELMRANDLLSAIALSDPLTELNNRRALEWELPRQIQNARTRTLPLSLVMLDVDYFKAINDTHGHLVGDRMLKLLSARLRHNLRFYDTPFRYGGEEFVIILSNTDGHEAPIVGQRICRLISEQTFRIDPTLEIHATISAGIASLEAEDDSKGISLLRRADQNLLQAKSEGRNRAISSAPDCSRSLASDSAPSV